MTRTACIAVCLIAGTAAAGDFEAKRLENWHQWRGPDATGAAPHGDPPLEWGQATNIRWKIPLPGEGSATPIVWNDRIWITSAIQIDRVGHPAKPAPGQKTSLPDHFYQFVVLCIDRSSGEIVWHSTAVEAVPHEGRHATNSYASASPSTDGDRLYVSFGSRGIFAYDFSGRLCWQRDLGDMRTRYGWGEGASPALYGSTLVVNWDHEDQSFVVALDTETGRTLWKVDRDEPTSWSTPLIIEHGGRVQVIISATRRICSYDLATGTLIWECAGLTTNVIPAPVASDGVVYCMSSYGESAALAISLDARGDITGSDSVVWRHDRGTPYVPSPLLYQGRIYFTSGNSTPLTVLDAKTGEPVIPMARLAGLSGNIYASAVAAAGRIYFTDRQGTTVVIKSDKKLEVLAVNRLDDLIDASPAIAGTQMFLRGQQQLYCLERCER